MEWTLEELKKVTGQEEASKWFGARVIALGMLTVLFRFGRNGNGEMMWVGHNPALRGGAGEQVRNVGGHLLPTGTGSYFLPGDITRIVSKPSEEVFLACFSRNQPVEYRNTALCASTKKGLSHMTGFLGCGVRIRNQQEYFITGIGKTDRGSYRWLVEGDRIKRRTNTKKATLLTGVYPKKGHCKWVRSKTITSIVRRPDDGGLTRMILNSRFIPSERIPAAYAVGSGEPHQLTFGVLGLPLREL